MSGNKQDLPVLSEEEALSFERIATRMMTEPVLREWLGDNSDQALERVAQELKANFYTSVKQAGQQVASAAELVADIDKKVDAMMQAMIVSNAPHLSSDEVMAKVREMLANPAPVAQPTQSEKDTSR